MWQWIHQQNFLWRKNEKDYLSAEENNINNAASDLKIKENDLSDFKIKMDNYYNNGETSLYNSLISSYNNLVNSYNADLSIYRTRVADYNKRADAFYKSSKDFYQQ